MWRCDVLSILVVPIIWGQATEASLAACVSELQRESASKQDNDTKVDDGRRFVRVDVALLREMVKTTRAVAHDAQTRAAKVC